MSNFIKIHRSLLEWEWWHDINTCRVFLFLLLKANWKDGNWKGVLVKRGSYISSLDKLAGDTDLTRDEVRTAIKHLISTKEITTQATRKYTVFTVVNYDMYQNDTTQNTTQAPHKSPTIPPLIPSIEERKEGKKNIKEDTNVSKKKFIPPTLEEVKSYCIERNNQIDPQRFIDFYTANGWVKGKGKPIKDWKACIRTWEKNKPKEQQSKSANKFNAFPQREYTQEDYAEIEKRMLQRR